MKTRFFACLAALAMLFGSLTSARAESKPVFVVSIANYDAVLADIDYLSSVVGQNRVNSAQIEGGFKLFTGGKGSDMLDRKAPWGFAVMSAGNEDFNSLVFLPVKDFDGLLTVAGNFGNPPKDEENGIKSLQVRGGPQVYMKPQNGYVFLSDKIESLAALPADPVALLSDLPKTYDIGMRAFVQNVPQEMRKQWIGLIRQGMEQGLRRNPDEDDNAFAMRKKLVEGQMAQFEQMLDELENFTLGINIDGAAKNIALEMAATGKPGSQIATHPSTTSRFGGFMQADAGVTGNLTMKVSDAEIKQSETALAAFREAAARQIDNDPKFDDDSRGQAKEIMKDILDIALGTIQTGKLDGAGTLALSEKSMNFYAGAAVHDGKAVEKLVKKLVDLYGADLREKKLDMAKYNGVTLHQIGLALPKEDAAEILGDPLMVTIGIADKAFYIAAGKQGLDSVKSAIDASASTGETKLEPASMNVAMTSVATFAASVDKNEQGQAMLDAIQTAGGKDHILATVKEIPNGSQVRIQVDEGVLRMLGILGQQRMNGGRRANPAL